eukprot:COSAG04_NODE_1138_length_8106_cov_4.244036_5_plen_111_part_00
MEVREHASGGSGALGSAGAASRGAGGRGGAAVGIDVLVAEIVVAAADAGDIAAAWVGLGRFPVRVIRASIGGAWRSAEAGEGVEAGLQAELSRDDAGVAFGGLHLIVRRK